MARPQQHSAEEILDAARRIVVEQGARSATVDRVIALSGVPKGSLYHRFGTIDDLWRAMWLRAVRRSQESFLEAIAPQRGVEAAVAGGLSLHDFAVSDPEDARLLAALRLEDVLGGVGDQQLSESLITVNAALGPTMRQLAREVWGASTRSRVERVMCATVDLPIGAIRRHLVSGNSLPPTLRPQLEAAIRAALGAVA